MRIPSDWLSWFAVMVTYVQDMVHQSVKLKSLRPSSVFLLGHYITGIHHLKIIQMSFGKDQHGLCEKDININDKQNYEAVLSMTTESFYDCLPGYQNYLTIMQYVNDGFLDKNKHCLIKRIEKI